VLSVADELSQWADVTVAFRRIAQPIEARGYRVIAIEPGTSASTALGDDNAARGLHPFQHLSYCRELRSFARQNAGAIDVVLEKGWRLSGWLSLAFQRAGVPAVLVENDIRFWTEPLDNARQLAKYALHGLSHAVAAHGSRRASAVIAETDELKAMLIERRRVHADRIRVIGLGVDHSLFRPIEQVFARRSFGVEPDAYVMVYVGAMDEYHDLAPVIDGLARSKAPVTLHVVGDGEYKARYEEQAARAGVACRFYGRVPHDQVPRHIAAADLCIAPYRSDAFRDRQMTFSTLKIPEYMACARPVVGVPSARVETLVNNGVSGFVLPNDAPSWRAFLGSAPSRERLASMRPAAARAVESITWAGTAAEYLDVCERVIGAEQGARAAAVADAASLVR
jgi:glycosyltransferase involved in cell wall biosynthesis